MSRLIDISGKRFGRLTVIQHCGSGKGGNAMWLARCDCGNETKVLACNLKTGNTTSCGCYLKQRIRETQRKDISGKRFGRLIALYPISHGNGTHNRQLSWKCQCDCGNETNVWTGRLISGHTQSCGCLYRDRSREVNTTHGLSKTPEYARALTRKRNEKKKQLDTRWVPEFEVFLSEFFPNCVICGSASNLATDHVYPLSKGHGLVPGNAIRLCKSCNSIKYNRMPDELSEESKNKILASAELFRSFLED